tara:strand:+ start:1132 stop:1563 length:432 start_codon:yes stop_codon:yes gene_type:complete
MIIILTKCILILIIYQILFFKIFKCRNKWFIQLIFVYLLSLGFFVNKEVFNDDIKIIIEHIIFFSSFIISYLLFLTLVFNDSPTLFYLFGTKKEFLKKKFINDRKQKLVSSGLINRKNKITSKGLMFIVLFEKLSWLFFLEKK